MANTSVLPSAPALLPAESTRLEVGPAQRLAWREQVLARVTDLEAQLEARRAEGPLLHRDAVLAEAARAHLEAARRWGARGAGVLRAWTGAGVERAWTNLHLAEVQLLAMATPAALAGATGRVVAKVTTSLPANDPRRRALLDRLTDSPTLMVEDRHVAVEALRAAYSASARSYTRVRSFRNVILIFAFLVTALAVGVGVVGSLQPSALNLCFSPSTGTVCPTGASPLGGAPRGPSGGDAALLELVGLIGAAIAGAGGLRHIGGTAAPYAVPVALALLKLPLGALTAVLGIVLVQGQFVPGLSELDTSGQILAWAAVCGAAQETVTRLVDHRAQRVLPDVTPDEPVPGRSARTGQPV